MQIAELHFQRFSLFMFLTLSLISHSPPLGLPSLHYLSQAVEFNIVRVVFFIIALESEK
jgi:hypothetical protein